MEGCQVYIIQESTVAGAIPQDPQELFFNLPKRKLLVFCILMTVLLIVSPYCCPVFHSWQSQ